MLSAWIRPNDVAFNIRPAIFVQSVNNILLKLVVCHVYKVPLHK